MNKLRFRQVHLDFHTSEHIDGIGSRFDKHEWQDKLLRAEVDSITCFSLCHHGWSYHPTEVGRMHPHLSFNLLRAQMDACKEVDINVPVYLSAGLNSSIWQDHPEWHEVDKNGKGADPLHAGFRKLCFNSPYLDHLCRLVAEAAKLFPEADGIFLDIIAQGQCCCQWCMDDMHKAGLDPENEADRKAFSQQVLLKYYHRTTEAARRYDPKMRIFHNSGHIQCGKTDILKYFSHLELESLPTGGWGYDHYPMSAAYARKLPLDFLGMTGKFHTTWGEFGGLKHPNALRYECSAMLASGSKCSIGDQLHPHAFLDESTYHIIGEAYREVKSKEAWCDDVVSAAALAVLSSTACNGRSGRGDGESISEIGASRLLLEGHFPFDIIDQYMDWGRYQVVVLPDDIPLNDKLCDRIATFISSGGKMIASGMSLLKADGTGFAFDFGAKHHGASPYQPDYLLPAPEVCPDYLKSPLVMYARSQRITLNSESSLGDIYDPYFNRSYRQFCSHQHTPYRDQPSLYSAGVMTENVLYFAHPVFSIYHAYGAVAYKDFILAAFNRFLEHDRQIRTNLPSQARLTLMEQPQKRRYILHLLYANTILRGADLNHFPDPAIRHKPKAIEVIDELNPLYDIDVDLKLNRRIRQIFLEPQHHELPFEIRGQGRISFNLQKLTCHQIVALDY